jgi:hypothetical protein
MQMSRSAGDPTPAEEGADDVEFILADFIVLQGFVSGPDGLLALRLRVRLTLRLTWE